MRRDITLQDARTIVGAIKRRRKVPVALLATDQGYAIRRLHAVNSNSEVIGVYNRNVGPMQIFEDWNETI